MNPCQPASPFLIAGLAIRPESPVAHKLVGDALVSCGDADGAIRSFRRALELAPNYTAARTSLGDCLRLQGISGAVGVKAHSTLELNSGQSSSHNRLGRILQLTGEVDAAISEFRLALELNPGSAPAHFNLAGALQRKGDREGAIAELHRTIELNPAFVDAHRNLGVAFQERGDFPAAIAAFKRALILAPHRAKSQAHLAQAERYVQLDKLLSGVHSRGGPADAVEQLELAEFAFSIKRQHRLAAHLFEQAFTANLVLAHQRTHRYNAACAAALSASEMNDRTLSSGERAEWRSQSLVWLIGDLQSATRLLTTARSPATAAQLRAQLVAKLDRWLMDPNLAAIRDPECLTSLPEPERAACENFWRDVGMLLGKLRQATLSGKLENCLPLSGQLPTDWLLKFGPPE